jgi:hypothetical protein
MRRRHAATRGSILAGCAYWTREFEILETIFPSLTTHRFNEQADR